MLFVSAGQLAAAALAGLQLAAPVASCGCGQFRSAPVQLESGGSTLSAEARALRDFVLFSHRRIGADLIARQGPYLDTLAGFFPHCGDAVLKLAWFRQVLASSGDTRLFAERLVQHYESSRSCTASCR